MPLSMTRETILPTASSSVLRVETNWSRNVSSPSRATPKATSFDSRSPRKGNTSGRATYNVTKSPSGGFVGSWASSCDIVVFGWPHRPSTVATTVGMLPATTPTTASATRGFHQRYVVDDSSSNTKLASVAAPSATPHDTMTSNNSVLGVRTSISDEELMTMSASAGTTSISDRIVHATLVDRATI